MKILVLLVQPIVSVRGEGEHVVDGIIRDFTLTPSALTNPLSRHGRVSELKGGIGKMTIIDGNCSTFEDRPPQGLCRTTRHTSRGPLDSPGMRMR